MKRNELISRLAANKIQTKNVCFVGAANKPICFAGAPKKSAGLIRNLCAFCLISAQKKS